MLGAADFRGAQNHAYICMVSDPNLDFLKSRYSSTPYISEMVLTSYMAVIESRI